MPCSRYICSHPLSLGSTTVYPHNDPELVPMELGASIFVDANKNLCRATKEFGLNRTDFEDTDGREDDTGIWDGETFVFRMGSSKGWLGSWWNSIRVVWRYGLSAPSKTQTM